MDYREVGRIDREKQSIGDIENYSPLNSSARESIL